MTNINQITFFHKFSFYTLSMRQTLRPISLSIYFIVSLLLCCVSTQHAFAEEKAEENLLEQIKDEITKADIGDALELADKIFEKSDNSNQETEYETYINELVNELVNKFNDNFPSTCTTFSDDMPFYHIQNDEQQYWNELSYLSRNYYGWPDEVDNFSTTVYEQINCYNNVANLDTVLENNSDGRSLRRYLIVLENLLARIPGNYRDALTTVGLDQCYNHAEKYAARLKIYQDYPESRYATRSLLIAGYSAIAYAQLASCTEGYKKDLLNKHLEILVEAFDKDNPVFKKSIGSWRYANDLIHYGIVISFLAGDSEKLNFFKGLFANEDNQQMINEDGVWNKDNPSLNIKSSKLIKEKEAVLLGKVAKAENYLPYIDTIYIYQRLPKKDGEGVYTSYIPSQFNKFHNTLANNISKITKLDEKINFILKSEDFPTEKLSDFIINDEPVDEGQKQDLIDECSTIIERLRKEDEGENDLPSEDCTAVPFNTDESKFNIGFFKIPLNQSLNLSDLTENDFVDAEIKSFHALPTRY